MSYTEVIQSALNRKKDQYNENCFGKIRTSTANAFITVTEKLIINNC